MTAQEIETGVAWWGRSGAAVEALVKCGFLDLVDGEYVVHDWLEHSGHIAVYSRRAKAAAKARWERTAKNAPSIENDASSIKTMLQASKNHASSNASSNATPRNDMHSSSSFDQLGGAGGQELLLGVPRAGRSDLTPEGLAEHYCYLSTRKVPREEKNPVEMAKSMRNLIDLGVSQQEIFNEIFRKGRDREEWFDAFKERLLAEIGKGKENGRTASQRPSKRCRTTIAP